jgi:hypothetical protein
MPRSVIALVLSAGTAVVVSASEGVPPIWRDLYAELQASLDRYENRLNATPWSGPANVLYSAELNVADSHRGRALLDTDPIGIGAHLDGITQLGVRAVTVNISLPVLHPAFHQSAAEYQALLDFYRGIAAALRLRNLQMIVKTQAIATSPDPRVDAFYRAIGSVEAYTRARVEVARTIAREINPDVMSVQMEPDTESFVTGQPVGTPIAAAALVAALADAVRAENPRIIVGAGAGTWFDPFGDHLDLLTRIPGLDFIDLHVYPATRDYLDRVLYAADFAESRGMRVAISEAWLMKLRESELALAPLLMREVVSRDVYDFWAPLDQRFLRLLAETAERKRIAFISPFWTNYFRAYLDYDLAIFLDPRTLTVASTSASMQALMAGRLTGTGLTYQMLSILGSR